MFINKIERERKIIHTIKNKNKKLFFFSCGDLILKREFPDDDSPNQGMGAGQGLKIHTGKGMGSASPNPPWTIAIPNEKPSIFFVKWTYSFLQMSV